MEGENTLNYRLLVYLGTFGMLLLACAVIVFIYLYQRKLLKKKIAFQEIEDLLKKQELRSAYALLEGQDIERKRIAQELHDNLGSLLVTLNMYTDTALAATDSKKKDVLISKINVLASQAGDETKKLSHRLDSVALKHFGLETALKDLKEAIEGTRSIVINTSVILESELDGELTHNLYRIIQELVNNTLKHAKAEKISIDLHEVDNQSINLVYKDDGIGFDHKDIQTGMGLNNIKSRVAKLSGELNIEASNKGTNVNIEIPRI
jgi:two-component system NarL family sensor kinase